MSYDIEKIRKDFPILSKEVHGKPLVYFDNAATTQKPLCVVDAIRDEYLNANGNVHRSVHYLAEQSTRLLEQARDTVRAFINAKRDEEIVFTRGTTESINLVASTFCDRFMQKGDEVILTEMEHHSNIVPWQLQQMKKGIMLKVIPMRDNGELNLDNFESMFSSRTKFVSVTHVSNVLGTVNPVKKIVSTAHKHGVPVLIDGAQSVPHFKVDVQDLDCDFLAFSGHKVYGPTGIGVLYGKYDWLFRLPPYQGGGEMIDHVSFEGTTFETPPLKFEAGTPNYIGSHALAVALDYVSSIGLDAIEKHEDELTAYALEQMRTIDGMKIFGHSKRHEPVISFQVRDIHHMDMGTLLDQMGVAVRTGHHCALPLMDSLGVLGETRASFGLYNTKEEIDIFVDAIRKISGMF